MTTRRAILTALERVHPFLLPEATLWADILAILPHAVTLTELRLALQELETTRQIVGVISDEGVSKYRITDNGRASLQA